MDTREKTDKLLTHANECLAMLKQAQFDLMNAESELATALADLHRHLSETIEPEPTPAVAPPVTCNTTESDT
jgi:hypothetical protein